MVFKPKMQEGRVFEDGEETLIYITSKRCDGDVFHMWSTWTMDKALDIVEWTFKNMKGSEIVIPKLKSFKIILTGGYSNLFKNKIDKKAKVEHDITIQGIIKIYKKFLI